MMKRDLCGLCIFLITRSVFGGDGRENIDEKKMVTKKEKGRDEEKTDKHHPTFNNEMTTQVLFFPPSYHYLFLKPFSL